MTYFDPHVWEDLSQQQKLKKESEQKNLPSIEKRDFLKIFCNKAVQVQQGRTNFPGPAHFYPSGPIHLSFHHFFFFNFFFIIGLHERSRTGHMIIVYWFSCLLSEPTHSSTGISDNCYRRPLSFGSLKNTSKSFIFVNRIYIYIYICVCVCVCVLLLLDCFFYLIKYGVPLNNFFGKKQLYCVFTYLRHFDNMQYDAISRVQQSWQSTRY